MRCRAEPPGGPVRRSRRRPARVRRRKAWAGASAASEGWRQRTRGRRRCGRSPAGRRAGPAGAHRAHAQQLGQAAGLHLVRVDFALDRPRSMTRMRSATSSTRSRFCSTTSSDRPVALAQAGQRSRRSPARSTAGCLRSARRAAAARAAARGARPAPGSAARRPTARRPRGRAAAPAAGNVSTIALDRAPVPCRPRRRARPGAGCRARVSAGKDAAALRHVADARAGCAVVRRHAGDVDAVERDAAGGRRQQADQRLQQGRLAHAVVAEDADALALAQLQRRRRAGPGRGRSRRAARRPRARCRRPARRRRSRIPVRSFGAAPDVDVAHLGVGQHLVDRAFASGPRPGGTR